MAPGAGTAPMEKPFEATNEFGADDPA